MWAALLFWHGGCHVCAADTWGGERCGALLCEYQMVIYEARRCTAYSFILDRDGFTAYDLRHSDGRVGKNSEVMNGESNSLKFEWDEAKADSNFSKHRVSFEEAKTVFDDPFYVDFYDPDHDDEERYIIVGQSQRHRLLVVSYTERHAHIRLISAREATRRERLSYEEK